MTIDKVIEAVQQAGFHSVEYTKMDRQANYFTGKRQGKAYEFKACYVESHDELELHGRYEGMADWFFMFDILEDDGWGGKY